MAGLVPEEIIGKRPEAKKEAVKTGMAELKAAGIV